MSDRRFDIDKLRAADLVRFKGANMPLIRLVVPLVLVVTLVFMSAYTVESGNVAIERTLGKVNHEEVGQGLNFKMPMLTDALEFSAKEIAIDINDLQPKAADNLSLRDLDVSVFYRVRSDRISELMVKYAASASRDAVEAEKRLEAKQVQVEIAKKDAEIEIARARGIAEANRIINSSLTAEYLQHEVNTALLRFADNDGSVVVLPANMQGFDLILDSSQLGRASE